MVKKFVSSIIMVLSSMLVLPGALREAKGSAGGNPSIRIIPPGEAYELIKSLGGRKDFVVLDIRTSEEYAQSHLSGSRLIDYYSPDFRDRLNRLDKKVTYLIYCRSGNRSGRALVLMRELGFLQVYDIRGGIKAWAGAGLPLARD